MNFRDYQDQGLFGRIKARMTKWQIQGNLKEGETGASPSSSPVKIGKHVGRSRLPKLMLPAAILAAKEKNGLLLFGICSGFVRWVGEDKMNVTDYQLGDTLEEKTLFL
jgi:hypothetical protein